MADWSPNARTAALLESLIVRAQDVFLNDNSKGSPVSSSKYAVSDCTASSFRRMRTTVPLMRSWVRRLPAWNLAHAMANRTSKATQPAITNALCSMISRILPPERVSLPVRAQGIQARVVSALWLCLAALAIELSTHLRHACGDARPFTDYLPFVPIQPEQGNLLWKPEIALRIRCV